MMKKLFSTFFLLAAAGAAMAAPPARPNIVFFLVDDMGWQDTSVPLHYDKGGKPIPSPGNATFKTPAMEKLASQGVCFTRAYGASVCSPTRTSVMSGMNPSRTHISNWTNPAKPADTSKRSIKAMAPPKWRIEGLNARDASMANMFKKEGYRTIFIGKAHFGATSQKEAQPEQLGFDVNIGGCGAGQPGSYYGKDNYAEQPTRFQKKQGPRDVPGLQQYHGSDTFLTEALTLELGKEMDKAVHMKKPFFAYMGHYAVHGPLMQDPRFSQLYPGQRAAMLKYATLISGMDKSLGDIIDKLEQAGVAENTLIVFASDNGGTAPKKNPCTPLRAGKGCAYEGGIRVPVIIAWARPNPGNTFQRQFPIKGGGINSNVIALQDLFATFGSIIGSSHVPAGLDSMDFSGYLRPDGKSGRPQTFFLNFPHEHNEAYYAVYINGDWKVIYRFLTKSWELYNVTDDIGETKNMAAEQPAILKKMAAALAAEFKRHDSQPPIETATNTPAAIVLP